ncbi:MAG: O-methyltransferase [Bacteroidota bacterium]
MINEDLYTYAAEHTTPELPVLAQLNRETHLSQVYPQMLSGHLQGTFLSMITHMIRPARILEIGTFTGYSAISMATAMASVPADLPGGSEAVLHTIEINPEQEEMIRSFIRLAGLEERIHLHIGDALEIIPGIDETWDMVFLDADKPNYMDYYNLVLPRLRKGGFIVADNVLWNGKVTGDPGKMDKDTRGICRFNDFVQHDDRVENMLLPLRDGLMMIRKLG